MGFIGTKKYVAFSVAAAVAAVYHAFATREQFFPAMVYLSSSKFSIAVLGNLGFALALSVYKVITTVFLGQLRDSELERINDKISQAVLETCLAMTIFRTDFTVSVVTMFVILSFVKIFHWLVQDRVDFIETTPNVTRMQHVRIVAFMFFLLVLDALFLQYTLNRTLAKGVSVHLLFAFEFAIQASTIIMTFVKYVLSMVDMAMEGRWEGKGVAVFYLELTLDLLHLMVYAAFFSVVFSAYGVPLYLVRDLWFTFRSFTNRLRDFLRYRRITANMDERFPDATEEDLARADHVCIICREELAPGGRNKKLSCNHVFHLHCLRSWLERQQSCPICRTSVLPPDQQPPPRQPQPAGGAPGHAPAPGEPLAPPGVPGGGAHHIHDDEDLVAAAEAAVRGGPLPPGWRVMGGGGGGGEPGQAGEPLGPRRRPYRAYTFQAGQPAGAGVQGVPLPGAAVYDPHQALPGYAMGGQVAGYVVNQWVPATSMALFVPAGGQLQYAGQQTPADVAAAAAAAASAAAQAAVPGLPPGMIPGLPILPIMMPPILPPTLAPALAHAGAPGVPDAAQQAAAAAAAAAAAMSIVAPHAPIMVPQQLPLTAAAPGDTQALQQMLQQQLDNLSAQLAVLRAQQAAMQQVAVAAPAPAPAPEVPSSPAPAAEPAVPPADQPLARDAKGHEAAEPKGQENVIATDKAQKEEEAAPEEAAPAVPVGAGAAEEAEGAGGEAAELRRRRLQRFAGAGGSQGMDGAEQGGEPAGGSA